MTNEFIIENPITYEYNQQKGLSEFINSLQGDIFDMVSYSNGKDTELENKSYELEDEIAIRDISKRKWVVFNLDYNKYFLKTQKWIGHVTKIDKSTFEAKLEDLTQGGTSEIGEFDMDEVSNDDKRFLEIGATFYWSVGYTNESGQTSKRSLIRFQRILNWDENYANNAADRSARLLKNLKWE